MAAHKTHLLNSLCSVTKSIKFNSIIILWICLTTLTTTLNGIETEHSVYHEFKVEIHGGMEECFFQHVPELATFYVSIEVLKGQDQKVDIFVRNEHMETVHSELAIQDTFYKMENTKEGTYSLCIDNVYSRFGSKIVFVYMTAFQMAKFEEYIQEMEAIDQLTGNASEALNSVQTSFRSVLMYQARNRFHMVRDMYLAMGNNYYVAVWSLCQCVVIVISAIVQVYMVRRLFRTSNVTPTTAKPRA